MIQRWVLGIERLAVVASRFPHSAYMGLVSCLIPDVGPCLAPVENALRTKFIPAILGIDGPTIDDNHRTLLGNGVKTGGLVIPDPTLAASLYSTSMESTDMLKGTLIRNKPISVEAHQTNV
ncbi:hypothetical protein ACHAW6_000817 [Cyclotella cf. meneghiniana]